MQRSMINNHAEAATSTVSSEFIDRMKSSH